MILDDFDVKFIHSSDCDLQRFQEFEKEPYADCYCQLKEIKSYITYKMKEVLEGLKKKNKKVIRINHWNPSQSEITGNIATGGYNLRNKELNADIDKIINELQ